MKTKCDCRDCSHKGIEGDHMVFCSLLGYFKSFGLRFCNNFKKNDEQKIR